MTQEKLYKVMILQTTGWIVPNPDVDERITKDQGKKRIDYYMSEGVSPDSIRVEVV